MEDHEVSLARLTEQCAALGLPHNEAGAAALLSVLPNRHGPRPLLLVLEEERRVVCFDLPALLVAPPERRAVVAAVAMHLNYGLLLGGFRLDLRDGELAFGLRVPYREVGFSRSQFEHCVSAIGWTLDRDLPLLLRAGWGHEEAEEILEIRLPSPLAGLLGGEGVPGEA